MSERIFIIDAKRSAISKFLGDLIETDIVDVASQVITGGFPKNLIEKVEKVIIGNVFSTGLGQGVARNIALVSGCKQETPAYSLNMVCGSGMQAVLNGVMELKCGMNLVLAGGIEAMSAIPYAVPSRVRDGIKLGDIVLKDLLIHDGLTDQFTGEHMGITAENVAKKYNVSREKQDAYAWESLQKTIKAIDDGAFKDEIVPVTCYDKRKNEFVFDTDSSPNRTSSLEKLAKLKPAFLNDKTGTVTAGNSSTLNDGASFVLLGTESFCKKNHIRPLAEIIDGVTVGLNPMYMGMGPYYAISALLEKTALSIEDIDVFEINEAFASQAIASVEQLALKYGVESQSLFDKCNRYGSGIGLGHPLGMTGARIITTLTHIMKNETCKYGVASLCIGGGMGAATLLRKVEEHEAF